MNRYETIRRIKGIGEKKETLYHRLGIFNINDLLYYYPWDYESREVIDSLDEVIPGDKWVVKGTLMDSGIVKRIRGNLSITRFSCKGEAGVFDVAWFNIPYLKNTLRKNSTYYFYGKIQKKFGRYVLENPEFKHEKEGQNNREILPKYSLTKGLTQKDLRKAVADVLDQKLEVEEYLEESLLQEHDLLGKQDAIYKIHRPKSKDEVICARRRLVIDELVEIQAGFKYFKSLNKTKIRLNVDREDEGKIEALKSSLPFVLTKGQQEVVNTILDDLKKRKRMNRLIQGDVGSGKTVVAALAQYIFFLKGYQSVIMAPTEILARQHEKTLKTFLEPFGIKVALFVGGMKKTDRKAVLEGLKDGTCHLAIGAHAIIQSDTEFFNLGLVITDEQHRFGVEQRSKLMKKGASPHVLVMSATPIPRTISHALYGDLDVSTINTMPKGRMAIRTHCIKKSRLKKVYGFILEEIQKKRQAFIVCPEIEQGENENVSASELYKDLIDSVFSETKVALVHGKMKADKKEEIMGKFSRGEIDVLVSTTVVEVGIDVPNATVMLIMDADRFGLATLHQLRGRVGRGPYESWCILATDTSNEKSLDRLRVLETSNDGFEIAQRDFELRGPGDYFGFKQHGLPEFKLTDLARDEKEIETAKKILDTLVENNKTETIEKIIQNFKKKIDNID
jgi:ATP-dependent DNA helicase RecG